MRKFLLVSLAVAVLVPIGAMSAGAGQSYGGVTRQVRVPMADRFTPYAAVIHVGDSVRWTNGDEDDHTVVSDDFFNTAGHQGYDQLLGVGLSLTLTFSHPGTFVYYCRFHATLDSYHQPIAPGPDGGIQDANGNYGTPMSGVITVLP
jgi:plastocyanin